ncbi:uncharacterized protein LOC141848954 [Brevipalpus obovatus]|uniref:uncharacterized protein LOC141848954 n=1 Tax=Brevipalpus obovatus TaxID=246614 RepID=UPI003D9DD5D2
MGPKIKREKNVKKLESTEPKVDQNDTRPACGLRKWQQEYNESIVDVNAMKKEIAEYLKNYEKLQQEAIERRKQMAEEVDDEGWVKVVNPKKKRLLSNSDASKDDSKSVNMKKSKIH